MFTTRTHNKSTRAIDAMERAFASLEGETIESGSIEGYSAVPDHFTSTISPRLRATIEGYLQLGPEPRLLEEKASRTANRKSEYDVRVAAYRAKYESASASPRVLGGPWHRPLTIGLLGLITGLALSELGVRVSYVESALIAAITVAIGLNHSRFPAVIAHCRDYVLYLAAAHQAGRMTRTLVKTHDRLEAELERRAWAERWLAEREQALVSLYELHRGRGATAAAMATPGCTKP